MEEDESSYADSNNNLPDDLDEETATLLTLANAHVAAKRIFVSENEVKKRSEEKDIPFAQARKELIAECKQERERLVITTKELLKPKLSKEVKEKLGIKGVGRPKESKNRNAKISQADFYKRLRQLAKSKNQLGEELNQKEAAKALGLGGERQLRKRIRDYGDERRWKDIVISLLA